MNCWVIEQNIVRFRETLRGKAEAHRRHEIQRLLAEVEAGMAELDGQAGPD